MSHWMMLLHWMQNVIYDLHKAFTLCKEILTVATCAERGPDSLGTYLTIFGDWVVTAQPPDNYLAMEGKGVAELLVDLNIEMLLNYQKKTKQKDSRGWV